MVLHMANTPRSFIEGIEMLKRGGMMLEMGNFADTGETIHLATLDGAEDAIHGRRHAGAAAVFAVAVARTTGEV